MAHCIRCGTETELYEYGVPMCTACIDERDRKRCPEIHIPPEEEDSTKSH
jgi:hypothetical protein